MKIIKITIRAVTIFTLLFATAVLDQGCTKFVTVRLPTTQLVTITVFTSDATANAAVAGIYSQMMQSVTFASFNITLYSGLTSDEFLNYSTDVSKSQFFYNAVTPPNADLLKFWGDPYQYILDANSVIEGLTNSAGVSAPMKKQLIAESKFIRAFCYFYLVNFFGDVPLITGTNYSENAIAARSPQEKVFTQIIADLSTSRDSLAADYSISNGEKTRPNKWAAEAMLARVYLYNKDWQNAISMSTDVINDVTDFALDPNLADVFLTNSAEAIWQLAPVTERQNTYDGYSFILTGSPESTVGQVSLSNELMSAFETGDNRKVNWTGSFSDGTTTYFFPYKYKVQTSDAATEFLVVLRLAEQYLIRAEAYARLTNISAAASDLNIIRLRAGLPPTNANDQPELLQAISRERRVEFFAEFGHRWLDLKRTEQLDAVLGPLKPNWQVTDSIFPIPQTEIAKDQKLTQNAGY